MGEGMKRFINVFDEIVASRGNQPALVGEDESFTYSELDELSGKIYAYLKDKGIGKECFVQIVLPRNVYIPVAMAGVIKAGAAFMLLEDTYPKERIEFIYKDCGCKVRIDKPLYDEIMNNYEPLLGSEDTDVHDACYAVYTSGSTGTPKGVLHEYGNLDEAYNSFETWYDEGIVNSAIYAPFYFVAGVLDFTHYVTRGRTMYIMPHSITRDFIACKKYIEDNEIHEMYMPPSLLRIYKEPAKCLKVLYTGSEPANGLTYENSPLLINFYAMSESGFVVLQKSLERAYDVAPVGKPSLNHIDACIIDEDGNKVEGPGKGELCFINKYVRGYINLPEQTKKTWRDGLYHTNDCVRRDANGDFYVVGRFDDMIKINGNRVEPVEIETHIKHLTGLEQVVAKGFSNPDRSYICLYYLNKEAVDKGLITDGELEIDRKKIAELLPDYMIPTYYVGVDSFPLTATGKVSRKDLKAPSTDDYKKEYVAPETDLEKVLCDKMAEVLRLDKVSVTDDFYSLGGDSMRSMMFVTLCNEANIGVTSTLLYDNRTPRELAKVCGVLDSKEDMDRIDDEAREKEWLLLPSQKGSIAFGWRSDTENVGNIIVLDELKPDVNLEKLCHAANKVLRAHPGMHIKMIYREAPDGEENKFQRYEPSYEPDCRIIDISDEEFENKVETLDEGYNLWEDRLYRCCIYKTETKAYFYLNMHHAISDGTSKKLLLEQITRAYRDDNYEVPRDYYFYMLNETFKEERWDKLVPKGSTAHLVKYDRDEEGRSGNVIYRPNFLPVDDKREGNFFVTALAMAVAKYNECQEVYIKETYSGRSMSYSKNIAAELATGILIDVYVTPDKSFTELQDEIKAIELYESSHPSNRLIIDMEAVSGVRFNYQKNTLSNGIYDEMVIPLGEDFMRKVHGTDMSGTTSLNIIEVEGKDTVDALFVYLESKYDRASMVKLMDIFEEIVRNNL